MPGGFCPWAVRLVADSVEAVDEPGTPIGIAFSEAACPPGLPDNEICGDPMQLTGRPYCLALLAAMAAAPLPCRAQLPAPAPYWEDPAVFAENREPPRASFTPFATVDAAIQDRPGDSPYRLSLNGEWRFRWVPRPSQRPTHFFEPDFDASTWHLIPVPSNWEFEGYGYPVYRDEFYSFPANPPFIPHDDNPVGSYRRTFEVPRQLGGAGGLPALRRRVFGVLRVGERRSTSGTARGAARRRSFA